MNKRIKKKNESQMCMNYVKGLCGINIYLNGTFIFCPKKQRECAYYHNHIPKPCYYKMRYFFKDKSMNNEEIRIYDFRGELKRIRELERSTMI